MAWWMAPVGQAVGGAVGKVLGKISEWIPSRDQYTRNKIKVLERERDYIIQAGIPNDMRPRLAVVLEQLRSFKTDLQNR